MATENKKYYLQKYWPWLGSSRATEKKITWLQLAAETSL